MRTVTLSTVVLLATVGIGTAALQSGSSAPAAETGAGQPVHLEVHQVTDPYTSSRPHTRPPGGFRWIAVELEVRNPGPRPRRIASLVDLTVRDAAGITYSPLTTGDDLPSPDGRIPPGGTTRGTVVFELPSAATASHLVLGSPGDTEAAAPL